MTDNTKRLAGWHLRLSEYEFDVAYCTEIKDQAADELSFLQTTGGNPTPPEDDLPILAKDVTENEERIYIIDENCEKVLPFTTQSSPSEYIPPNEEDIILE